MPTRDPIRAIKAKTGGRQFVVYGDSCSGVAGARHEGTFGQVNDMIRALDTPPQFICFPGDEIMGLTTDAAELRRQWKYFFEREMDWLDRAAIPLYHTSGNHTVYDRMSENVFRDVMAHLPQNGPPDQRLLSYFVRDGDLLIVFVNTMWSAGGGEGTVETEWLEKTLTQHHAARHKLVCGHHPVWAVNGYYGDYQRQIERQNGKRFWDVLLRHDVLAYFCSHILAFDVQVQRGVLQICTAGAGTARRMPAEHEYLHFVQAALDQDGLRYQVLDHSGRLREWLSWNWRIPPSASWALFTTDAASSLRADCFQELDTAYLIIWEIAGRLREKAGHEPQTILCARDNDDALPGLWLGISGVDRRITLTLSPEANRSRHRWHGPALPMNQHFCIQVAVHSGMGPGGLLWRWHDEHPWSSMAGASPWGVERLHGARQWQVAAECNQDLRLKWHYQTFALNDLLR